MFLKSVPHKECTEKLCGPVSSAAPVSLVAPVSSAAPKKKSFDRGGPVWPPRSNAADDRLGGVSGGQRPLAKIGGEIDFFRIF